MSTEKKYVDLVYESYWHCRVNKVAQADILLNWPVQADSRLVMLEHDDSNNIINDNVPFQIHRHNKTDISNGTLYIYLKGRSTATRRYFSLYEGSGVQTDYVSVEDEHCLYQQYESNVIRTKTASYFYHNDCGGLAGLFDSMGNDWLGYKPGGGSAGEYRGVPNMIYTDEGGGFHPGVDGCKTRIVHKGPICICVESVNEKFGGHVHWEFYPDYARMTVLKHTLPYWVLYEGTPGGKFEQKEDFLILPNGEKKSASEIWHDFGIPWIIFGDGKTQKGLFFIRHGNMPDIEDSYWPMEANMTVWGFGRKRKEAPLCALLNVSPLSFTIGFTDDCETAAARELVESCYNKDCLRLRF